MNIGQVEAMLVVTMMAGLGLILLSIALGRYIVALLKWMERRGWIRYSGDPHIPTYRTLGTGLMSLQAIADPRQRYVVEAKLREEEETEDEDEGGPDKTRRKRKRRRRSRRH